MLKIKGNKIYLTRGDTLRVEIILKDESNNVYEPAETDTVYFRLKKSSTAKDILVEKEIDKETMMLEIDEVDTMDLRFGTYYYEVELVTQSGYHFTAIANTEFEITTELENHG